MKKVIVNCETGAQEELDMTPEQEAEHKQFQAEAQADEQAREAAEKARADQRQADLDAVDKLNPSDPKWKAAFRRLMK